MTGRPSIFSEELADRICNELMEGKSLVKICEAEDAPSRTTVIRWMGADESFGARCARAREAQADMMDDKILDLADKCTSETAAADRVKLAAYQWRASKLAPKKYGEKLDLNVAGTLQTTTDETLDARIAQLLGKAGTAASPGGTAAAQEPE